MIFQGGSRTPSPSPPPSVCLTALIFCTQLQRSFVEASFTCPFELCWPFFQRSRTVCAILVEGIVRNISAKLFEFGPVVKEEMLFKGISIFSLADHFVQGTKPICAL